MENPIPYIRAILQTTPLRWTNLAQSDLGPLLAQKPNNREWSAMECLQHMVDTELVFRSRLHAFLEGRESFPAFNPDAEGSQGRQVSMPELTETFAQMRAESLSVIDRITLDDFSRKSRHAELGPVTLGELLHEWAAHDLNHTVQAERAVMQPFVRASGPWQRYFTDHLIPEA